MTILVVEDERKTADTIQSYLEHAGYGVAVCSDGAEALNEAASGRCDLVVLDLALPTVDGIEICRALRESGRRVPIVMLTARTTEDDRVHGFDVGADDYVTKPFSPRELVRRVGAVLRRARSPANPVLRHGELVIDLANAPRQRDADARTDHVAWRRSSSRHWPRQDTIRFRGAPLADAPGHEVEHCGARRDRQHDGRREEAAQVVRVNH